jgi:mannosyltransferase
VSYAQTARAYALVALLVALSCYFFVGELENPSRRGAIGYVLTTTLSFYAHYFSAFVVLVQVLTVVAVQRRAAFSRRWIVMVGLVAVLCAPEAYAAVVAGPQGIYWIAPPNLRDVASFAAALSGGDRVLAVILFALAGFGAVMAVRGDGGRGGAPRWKIGFLVAWLSVPVVLAFILSFAQPIFAFHYLLVTMPAFVVLIASGIVRLGRRAGVVALVVVVGLSVHSVVNWYEQPSREDFRAAAAYVTAHARPGDRLMVWPWYASTAMSYYLDRTGGGASAAQFVPHGRMSGDPPRLWLVIRDFEVTLTPGQLKAFEGSFDRRYRLVSSRSFSGVTELSYRRDAR